MAESSLTDLGTDDHLRQCAAARRDLRTDRSRLALDHRQERNFLGRPQPVLTTKPHEHQLSESEEPTWTKDSRNVLIEAILDRPAEPPGVLSVEAGLVGRVEGGVALDRQEPIFRSSMPASVR
eukprot:4814331-Prymnesium_polylepis.1